MVERNPWYNRVEGPFPERYTNVGVKADGGGSMRGRGIVGEMKVHRAVFNRDAALIEKLLDEGENVNEVEAAGNTPLHCAAYDGWREGVDLLVARGAKLNASNNAGDTPYIWAQNMLNDECAEALKTHGADPEYRGRVIVPEHVPKVKDFYDLPDGKDHPKPSLEYLEFQRELDRRRDLASQREWDRTSAPGAHESDVQV
jgi:hypothetical protein